MFGHGDTQHRSTGRQGHKAFSQCLNILVPFTEHTSLVPATPLGMRVRDMMLKEFPQFNFSYNFATIFRQKDHIVFHNFTTPATGGGRQRDGGGGWSRLTQPARQASEQSLGARASWWFSVTLANAVISFVCPFHAGCRESINKCWWGIVYSKEQKNRKTKKKYFCEKNPLAAASSLLPVF